MRNLSFRQAVAEHRSEAQFQHLQGRVVKASSLCITCNGESEIVSFSPANYPSVQIVSVESLDDWSDDRTLEPQYRVDIVEADLDIPAGAEVSLTGCGAVLDNDLEVHDTSGAIIEVLI